MPEETIPVPTCFFRFVVVWYSGSRKKQLGILRFAGRVLEWQKTTCEDEQALRELVWFKPESATDAELWGRLTALVRLLLKYRYRVEVITTKRPGKILYDDAAQVAAVPFNDTFGQSHILTDKREK